MAFSIGDYDPTSWEQETTPLSQEEVLKLRLDYNQKRRFTNSRRNNFYLLDVEKRPNCFVLKMSGSTMNIYEIRVLEDSRTIVCNCPDGCGHCRRENTICKHSYFMLFKMLNMWELSNPSNEFFNTNVLSETDLNTIHEKLMEIMTNNFQRYTEVNPGVDEQFLVPNYINRYQHRKITRQMLKESKVQAEGEGGAAEVEDPIAKFRCQDISACGESCPVCYNNFESAEETLRCPCCKNHIHTTCMNMWFKNGKNSCVLCRSTVWEEYIDITQQRDDFYQEYESLYDLVSGR